MVEVATETHIRFEDVTVRYGAKVALRNISMEIPRREIFGIIGPANSGKTTLLKCVNRMIEFVPGARVEGHVNVNDEDVRQVRNVYWLRRKIGMVFPLPVGRRLADQTAFFNASELVEVGPTEKVFEQPENQLTLDYVSGSFG